MALETALFAQDVFNYSSCKDLYSLSSSLSCDGLNGFVVESEFSGLLETNNQTLETYFGSTSCVDMNNMNSWEFSTSSSIMQNSTKDWDSNSSPDDCTADASFLSGPNYLRAETLVTNTGGRRKRRRARSCKNKEDVENQRITHIVVERNRRKQMNDYLAVLRSLMPASYVQRGDQASIVAGAINFVKELEHLLQSVHAQKQMNQKSEASFSLPFEDFFGFPQYSYTTNRNSSNETLAENHSAIANIEVTMVESHASLKIVTRRRPKQLLKMVATFQNLHLTVLHLNVTTIEEIALYCFSVKVEDNCGLTSVDGIATAIHQLLGRIQEEASDN